MGKKIFWTRFCSLVKLEYVLTYFPAWPIAAEGFFLSSWLRLCWKVSLGFFNSSRYHSWRFRCGLYFKPRSPWSPRFSASSFHLPISRMRIPRSSLAPRKLTLRPVATLWVLGILKSKREMCRVSFYYVLRIGFRRTSPATPAGPTATSTSTRRTRSKLIRGCARQTGKHGLNFFLHQQEGLGKIGLWTKMNETWRVISFWIVCWTLGSEDLG